MIFGQERNLKLLVSQLLNSGNGQILGNVNDIEQSLTVVRVTIGWHLTVVSQPKRIKTTSLAVCPLNDQQILGMRNGCDLRCGWSHHFHKAHLAWY